MSLYLVRHGRPLVRPDVPPHEWELDPAGYDDVWALRESGRIPPTDAWYSSPEPKATATAQLLTDRVVGVVPDLREHVRASTDWHDDFPAVVRRAFAEPDRAAHPGWEPLDRCRARVGRAVTGILSAHGDQDVVLVGHGTAWTVVVAELSGRPPDLDRWALLGMPDVIEVAPGLRST